MAIPNQPNGGISQQNQRGVVHTLEPLFHWIIPDEMIA